MKVSKFPKILLAALLVLTLVGSNFMTVPIAEGAPGDNFLESSHTVTCGSATITLRNVSPWIYPMTVQIDGVTSYGPVVDNRTDGGLSGPQKDQTRTRTINFAEDTGTHTVRYRVEAGSENKLYKGLPVGEWTEFTVESDCLPNYTTITAIKRWLGGGPDVKPTIKFLLFRDNVAVQEPDDPLDPLGPMRDAVRELVNGVTEVTWVNMPICNGAGMHCNYTVREIEVLEGYDQSKSGHFEVINTYKTPPENGNTGGGGNSGGGGSGVVIIPDEELPQGFSQNKIAYIEGYPEGDVRPLGNVTRAEVAAVFFRLLEPKYRDSILTLDADFPDMDGSEWASKYIGTLVKGGLLIGYPDMTFKPRSPITRAELVFIASKFDKLAPTEKKILSDISGHWAEESINSANAKGWVTGYPDGTFKPDQYITRAELVTLVNKVLDRDVKKDDILQDGKQFPDLLGTEWYYEAMQEAINIRP